jgi:hypothetical protein
MFEPLIFEPFNSRACPRPANEHGSEVIQQPPCQRAALAQSASWPGFKRRVPRSLFSLLHFETIKLRDFPQSDSWEEIPNHKHAVEISNHKHEIRNKFKTLNSK